MLKSAAGVEIYADRSAAAIVTAGVPEEGFVDIELTLLDVPAAVGAVTELWKRGGLEAVAIDPGSNAATLIDPLKRAGVRVAELGAHDMAVAHGAFADLLKARKVLHRGQAELTAAIQHAHSRRLRDGSAVKRYGNPVEVAPAVAAEIACWAVTRPGSPQPFALWGNAPGDRRAVRGPGGDVWPVVQAGPE